MKTLCTIDGTLSVSKVNIIEPLSLHHIECLILMFKVRDIHLVTVLLQTIYLIDLITFASVQLELKTSFPSMDVLKNGKFKVALQRLKLKRNDSQAITSNVWCLIIVDIDKGVNRLACPADDALYLLSLSASFNDTLSKLDQTLEEQTLGSNLLDSYLRLRNIGNLEEKSIICLYIMTYNILIEAPINIVDIHLNDINRSKIKYFLCCGQLYF